MFKALKVNKNRIEIITQERITDEMNKIILSNHPSIGFKSLFSSGILQIIFPEMADLQGVENKNGKTHKDNFYHTLEVLENILPNTNDLWLRWAAITARYCKTCNETVSSKSRMDFSWT